MIEQASKSLGLFSEAIRLAVVLLLAVVFTGVGVMLVSGGRPEAIVPLFLGAGAIAQLPKRFVNLYRDFTGNY
jgi:hypothetical protein